MRGYLLIGAALIALPTLATAQATGSGSTPSASSPSMLGHATGHPGPMGSNTDSLGTDAPSDAVGSTGEPSQTSPIGGSGKAGLSQGGKTDTAPAGHATTPQGASSGTSTTGSASTPPQ